MDLSEIFADGDNAELGRLIEVLGKVYLSVILKASITEDGTLEKRIFEWIERGTTLNTNPQGITFVVNYGAPVSMDLSDVQKILRH